MRGDSEKEYLFKVIDTFQKRLIVVSPEFKILAASYGSDGKPRTEIVGKLGNSATKSFMIAHLHV
ncbi:MAG: hypothetical protein JRJ27_17900 [Deltaproteobacteria bacterium]|nr:hypothetical protein [Deltaproteobacteria bacterium]